MELIEIDAVVSRKENPYIDDVKQLIAATNAYNGPDGKAPAGKFVVPNGDAQKTVFYIQQAAIEQGVTARIASPLVNATNSKGNPERRPVADTDDKGKETGNTTLLFKITAKRKENGRKPRNSAATTEQGMS